MVNHRNTKIMSCNLWSKVGRESAPKVARVSQIRNYVSLRGIITISNFV